MEMLAKQPFHYFGDGDEGRYVKVGESVDIRDDLVPGLKAAGMIVDPGTELEAPAEPRTRARRKR